MMKHIVLWKLKPEAEGKTAAENALIIRERLEGLFGKIPEIRSIRVDLNMPDMPGNYDLALTAEFESPAAMSAYQKNPLHEDVAAYVQKAVSERAAIDIEV